jgi:hypothetical protein
MNMKVIVMQIRKASTDPNLAMMLHKGYKADEMDGQYIVADSGYEIGAVWFAKES